MRLFFAALVGLILLPKIGSVDYSVLPLCITAAGGFLMAVWGRKRWRFLLPDEVTYALLGFLALQLAALVPVIHYGKLISEDILLKPLRQIVILVALAACFSAYRMSTRTLENVIITAAVANGVVLIVQYVLHNLALAPTFLLVPGFDLGVNAPFRKPGLMAGYPVAGLLGVYGSLLVLSRLRNRPAKLDLLCLLVCVLSVVLSSRMALLMFLVVMLGYGAYSLLVGRGAAVVSIVFILLLPAAAYTLGRVNPDTRAVMFEMFINELQGKGFSSESGSALASSYVHWPHSLETFLVGNGLSAKSDDGYTVDSSAQIVLFGGGIIALVGYNVLLLFYFWVSWTRSRGRIVIAGLFVLNIISNLKGNYLFSRVIGDVLTLVFVSYVYSHDRRNQSLLLGPGLKRGWNMRRIPVLSANVARAGPLAHGTSR